jgi:hypothetical protein
MKDVQHLRNKPQYTATLFKDPATNPAFTAGMIEMMPQRAARWSVKGIVYWRIGELVNWSNGDVE